VRPAESPQVPGRQPDVVRNYRRFEVISLLVLGVLCVAGVMVLGVLAAVASLVGFVISLPFRILGLMFKLIGLVIALPFLLIAGVLGLGFALFPLLPLVGLGALAWWLFRDHDRSRKPQGSHASVVS
jgi:hypothetical protein